MFWEINYLKKKIRERSLKKICERCGLLYEKKLENCPHCYGVEDIELDALLAKRAKLQMSLGKGMFIGAFAIVLLLLLYKFI